MKGKLLENIVLAVGLLIIASASFLMFYDKAGIAAKSINLIFATGFIIYIIYSYILSQNLNGEIYSLKKHVSNLKEEVARLKENLAKRDATIATQKKEIAELTDALEQTRNQLEKSDAALAQAKQKVADLKQQLEKEQ